MASSQQLSPEQLQNEPALQPPPGVIPNFVDPPGYDASIRALEGVFMALMLIALGVRICVRVKITRVWGWDDCMLPILHKLYHNVLTRHRHMHNRCGIGSPSEKANREWY